MVQYLVEFTINVNGFGSKLYSLQWLPKLKVSHGSVVVEEFHLLLPCTGLGGVPLLDNSIEQETSLIINNSLVILLIIEEIIANYLVGMKNFYYVLNVNKIM